MGTPTQNRINGKKGGRPKGTLSDETLAKQESMRIIRERVFGATNRLINAQLGSAIGSQYLFKILTDAKGSKSEPIRVEDEDEIISYLRGDYEPEGELYDPKHIYYFLTAKDPETKASEALLNRVHGRATESVELTNPDGKLKGVTIIKTYTRPEPK